MLWVSWNLKILVIGGTGLVGRKCIAAFSSNEFEVFSTYHDKKMSSEGCLHLDITDMDEIYDVFQNVRPDVVIHTAAFIDVDGCEREQEKAFMVNVRGTEKLARISNRFKAKLVYVSSDYVFDGKKGMYTEDDTVHPVNYYGKSKLLGEEQVKAWCSNFLICRTAVVYGVDKKNFALWLVDNLSSGNKVRIVDDQYVSCTLNTDLAGQMLTLVSKDAKGVFHTAGAERMSRYDFALRLAAVFGFDAGLITPVPMNGFDWYARRPADSSLDVTKITSYKKPLTVKEGLEKFYDEWKETIDNISSIVY